MECNGGMCVSFLSHSAFVGGSSNAGPFGSSQDLSCFFSIEWFICHSFQPLVHYCVAIQKNNSVM